MAPGSQADDAHTDYHDSCSEGQNNGSPPQTKRQRTGGAAESSRKKTRVMLACDVCRARRTKCNGAKPVCSFCKDNTLKCVYRTIPEQPPTKLESELSTIRKRLDSIEGLLSRPQQPSSLGTEISSSPACHAHATLGSIASTNDRTEDIPIMVIQNGGCLRLLGVNYDLGRHLITLERLESHHKNQRSEMQILVLQHHQASKALKSFYKKVYIWYPILHPNFEAQYFSVIQEPLTPSPESCLVLIIAAIGFLPQATSLHNSSRLDVSYFKAAQQMLPVVLIGGNITAVQCLIFMAIYYCCLVQPIQAHDYVLMASLKVQNILKSYAHDENHDYTELVHRSYWAILLIETEISVQLDLAQSNIWSLEDKISLPLCSSPGRRHHMDTATSPFAPAVLPQSPEKRTTEYNPCIQQTSGILPQNSYYHPIAGVETDSAMGNSEITQSNDVESYYLAEIALRRILYRCDTSICRHPSKHIKTYAPIVAKELVHQLEEWYSHLPSGLCFDRKHDAAIEGPNGSALRAFLRTQYYSGLLSIYWPAVYEAIKWGNSGDDIHSAVEQFFDCYIKFMMSVNIALSRCAPNLWTLYASMFIFSLAASTIKTTPCLVASVTQRMNDCLDIAIQSFKAVANISPSLDCLGEILTASCSQ